MNKYTVIFALRWQRGSHWQRLTKMARVEAESAKAILDHMKDVRGCAIRFIIQGHPLLESCDKLESPIQFISKVNGDETKQ